MDNYVYIAVNGDIREDKNNLVWCINTFRGVTRKIILLVVFQPPELVPGPMGGKVQISTYPLEGQKAFIDDAKKKLKDALYPLIIICKKEKVDCTTVMVENSNIGQGIIEAIGQYEIRKLVMGAAEDRKFNRKMAAPTSVKAKYVAQNAPSTCHIWFVCKGNRIYVHEATSILLSTSFSREEDKASTSETTVQIIQPQDRRQDLGPPPPPLVPILSATAPVQPQDGGFHPGPPSYPTIKEDIYEPHVPTSRVHPQEDSGSGVDELYRRLNEALEESNSLRKQMLQSAEERQQVQRQLFDALRKVTLLQMDLDQVKTSRRESDEIIDVERAKCEKLLEQNEDLKLQMRKVSNENNAHLSRIDNLERKLRDTTERLHNAQREKVEIMMSRDEAIQQAKASSDGSVTYSSIVECSKQELEEATNGFNAEALIKEGKSTSVFKGWMRHAQVAIKTFNEDLPDTMEFRKDVIVLSRMRHPRVVALVAACPDPPSLIYEYLPNGCLDDYIPIKNNETHPLTWQTRTRIIADICSAVLYLHSSGVIHGNLRPDHILLDEHFNAKLGGFGISNLVSQEHQTMAMMSTNSMLSEVAFSYMDPEFLRTGELNEKSDIYSFGVVILQLLTGRPPLFLPNQVQKAAMSGKLQGFIDPSAGEWPSVQYSQLATLGLKCCQMNGSLRPDLESDVWKVLEPMKEFSEKADYSKRDSLTDQEEPPPYFICPISQQVMRDPQVAADGFTYEAEQLYNWFNSGHDTSPMTNLKLTNLILTPNLALRSAISEWNERSTRC